MMVPTGFILAILGCGEADAQCQQVQLVPARYESRAQCLAAQEEALSRYDDPGHFPVVVAECRPATERFVALRADEVRRPEPQGNGNVRTASAGR